MTTNQIIGASLVSLPFVVVFFAMVKDIGLGGALWVVATTLGTGGVILAGVVLIAH